MTAKRLSLRRTTMRKRFRNIVVFPCEDFKMSTAGEGKARRFSQGSRYKIIEKKFPASPLDMSSVIGLQ